MAEASRRASRSAVRKTLPSFTSALTMGFKSSTSSPLGPLALTAPSATGELKGGGSGKNLEAAKKVGEAIAKKALEAGVKKVAFDRGAYLYHGRVKALADAARSGGLEF